MKKETEIPKKYCELVGTTKEFRGGLFSNKAIEPTKFEVQGIRWSDKFIMNMKNLKAKYPCFELLLINDSMNRAKWSKPFPIREINLEKK